MSIQPNYLACGFGQDGIRREAALYPADWKDPILMAVLQPECAPATRDAAASGRGPA
jgi:hypothetical protein